MAKRSSVSSQPAGLTTVKSEDIMARKLTKEDRQALRHAAKRQASGDDSDIDFTDVPRLTGEQLASMVRLREVRRKVAVSVRLDPQVVDWLKSKGGGHLTRINDILTNLMEAERRAGHGPALAGLEVAFPDRVRDIKVTVRPPGAGPNNPQSDCSCGNT